MHMTFRAQSPRLSIDLVPEERGVLNARSYPALLERNAQQRECPILQPALLEHTSW